MDARKCKCGAGGELRLDMQDTAYGPVCEPVCFNCYAKDAADRRAEGRRLRYRPRIVPWTKLEVVQE